MEKPENSQKVNVILQAPVWDTAAPYELLITVLL